MNHLGRTELALIIPLVMSELDIRDG